MEIKITGEPKEIAALVVALQERQDEAEDQLVVTVHRQNENDYCTESSFVTPVATPV